MLEKLLSESLAAAKDAGALHLSDLKKVAIAHPTDYRLLKTAVMNLGFNIGLGGVYYSPLSFKSSSISSGLATPIGGALFSV